jgi:hypothetical protein
VGVLTDGEVCLGGAEFGILSGCFGAQRSFFVQGAQGVDGVADHGFGVRGLQDEALPDWIRKVS